MRISDMHPVERPRERLADRGAQALGDDELLAAVLRTGYAGRSALEVARQLLRQYPDGALGRLPVADLLRLKGMGPSRACALAAALELARRWDGQPRGIPLDEPGRAWDLLHELRGKRKEHFVALYLNARNELLHKETVSVGTLTASLVHPREVFAPAVEHRAARVIIAHNHPSGDRRPSPEDREATRRIAHAGRILGIDLVDHLIVTESGWLSFRQEGLL